MNSSKHFLYFLKEISTVNEKLAENQINKLREIWNSVSDEFEKYDKPSETVLNDIDQFLVANACNNSFIKRGELGTRLKFNIIFLAAWRFLIDELILQSASYKHTLLSKTTYTNNASSNF